MRFLLSWSVVPLASALVACSSTSSPDPAPVTVTGSDAGDADAGHADADCASFGATVAASFAACGFTPDVSLPALTARFRDRCCVQTVSTPTQPQGTCQKAASPPAYVTAAHCY